MIGLVLLYAALDSNSRKAKVFAGALRLIQQQFLACGLAAATRQAVITPDVMQTRVGSHGSQRSLIIARVGHFQSERSLFVGCPLMARRIVWCGKPTNRDI